MKFWQVLLTLILAAAVSWGVSEFNRPAASDAGKETVYDRVVRTGTLNCGYFIWPPLHVKDPNTGAFSGISYEVTQEIGRVTGLKINWAGELAFSTYLTDIQSGRYDAECGQGWPNGVRGKLTFYSKPFGFIPLVAVVREGDMRFDSGPEKLNSPDVTLATMDGETGFMVARNRLPDANQVMLTQNSNSLDMIMNVVTNKADATLVDALTAEGFMRENPGKVRMVQYKEPLHLIALNFTLPQDEKLRSMIDVATDELLQSGAVEAIFKKYETTPGVIWRVGETYKKN
ncbi:MAG: substrate-binding periplasmic protein [Bdellovibrionales bacterium]